MAGTTGRHVAAVIAAAALLVGMAAPASAQPQDPPYSVDGETLDQSLDCPESFSHPDREPVLLVHGTFTRGHEQFDWNWFPVLTGMGFDVCLVTYPDRGFGDQQISAEYVAHALITLHERTGRQVDLMGHSQGASMPRWAVTFWPSARAALDDYVGIAGPYHGTEAIGAGQAGQGGTQPEAFFQFRADSRFVTILNEGDETPGAIDWTNLYTELDELVQPVRPVPTAALDFGEGNPRVTNVLLQDPCPGRQVDHLTIGTTDRLAFDLAVDAFVNDGPADVDRLDLGPECSVADQLVEDPDQAAAFTEIFLSGLAEGFPDLHLADEEPPTRDYAQADGQQDDVDADPNTTAAPYPPAPSPTPTVAAPASSGAPGLPATGGGVAAAALVVALSGLAFRSRRRR